MFRRLGVVAAATLALASAAFGATAVAPNSADAAAYTYYYGAMGPYDQHNTTSGYLIRTYQTIVKPCCAYQLKYFYNGTTPPYNIGNVSGSGASGYFNPQPTWHNIAACQNRNIYYHTGVICEWYQ